MLRPWTLQQYGPSGEAANQAIVKMIKLRYTLLNYTMEQMALVAETGLPVNRPLSFEYPEDAQAWKVTDQFMFGAKYMTAPVYHKGARNRSVYFPKVNRSGGCASWAQYQPAAGGGGANGSTGNSTRRSTFEPGETAVVPVLFDELAMFECVQ